MPLNPYFCEIEENGFFIAKGKCQYLDDLLLQIWKLSAALINVCDWVCLDEVLIKLTSWLLKLYRRSPGIVLGVFSPVDLQTIFSQFPR